MTATSIPTIRAAVLGLALAGVLACSDDEPAGPQEGNDPADAIVLTGNITTDRTLSPDSAEVYVLSGYVKVTNGATLTIEPGTTIVGDTLVPGSSLWILRGARIIAEGTADRPIVFTSQRAPGHRRPGDWGGIIIIGNGIINRTGSTILTEGPAGGVAENYAGGTDNNDSSGSLRYVRIEFAGYDVSGGAGQELNALSMYAVGRGTRIEYVQALAGLDDSFEWWGGAVDTRYLVSVEAGDDHFDWTEGYQGRNQFLIAFQNTRLDPRPGTGTYSGDPNSFEGDGCDPSVSGCVLGTDTASTPLSNPVFANFTVIHGGNGASFPAGTNGLVLRRGTAGAFYNGIVARHKGTGLNIRDAFTDRNRQAGRLDIRSLAFVENGANFDPESGSNFGKKSNFPAHGLIEVDGPASSLFVSLDPANPDFTPTPGSPVTTGGSEVPAERVQGYFGGTWQNTTYLGAASPDGPRWWQGWTSFATD
jgi:hypothetical protein